jgi:flavin reductase (DIM6/NTAB) family NADH-FMN oxidoreductase RutF
MFKSIDPNSISHSKLHQIILSAIAPRPIAFASTVDSEGNHNLSPFSFYNAFGVNPSTLIFSPSRRGRDNTTKHTYDNVLQVPEVVLNAVSYSMVEQMSLSSTEYPEGVNEFIKAGFTMLQSDLVRPMRVKESPVQFECKVREVIPTGDQGGAGNLVICEILKVHIREDILDANGQIDQDKIDLIGRLGGDLYCRTSGNASFLVRKPLARLGMGIDQLPERIRFSPFLTGNHLGKLGNTEQFPDQILLDEVASHAVAQLLLRIPDAQERREAVHELAASWLDASETEKALALLLIEEQINEK